MSHTKTKRAAKRQLGQFYTPEVLARRSVAELPLTVETTVLEPSAGNGAFVIPLIERFLRLHKGSRKERLRKTLTRNIFAIEIDPAAYAELLAAVEKQWGTLPPEHNLVLGDFFNTDLAPWFDHIIGNPPFGGTIDPELQNRLDKRYGQRDGCKIKKETYSFFIVRSVEMLNPGGTLRFICSDTFLTIPTMKGLREFLLNRGRTSVDTLQREFDETTQPMVLLNFTNSGRQDSVAVDGRVLPRADIDRTGNRSWQVSEALGKYFHGPKLGDFMVASSGMTIGRNELFVRDVVDDSFVEPYKFEFRNEPITLARETERAREGYLSDAMKAKITEREARGETRRNVVITPREKPLAFAVPHPDYCYYNKSRSEIVFAPPRHVVYWKDDGDAVVTFKKNGNWYLHGVGGQPYFKCEGLCWQLIAPALNARYLPAGYILDSGAPCAFLRDGVEHDELWFILGWCLTPLCTRILKEVLNHTRNIQSKDFERLPYPYWVPARAKAEAVKCMKRLVHSAMNEGKEYRRTDPEILKLGEYYMGRQSEL